ncbi:hypothetical protein M2137_001833 [Parabacteroides sp. PFB2-10]|uniref:DUF4133 domain-containing protein n=1 Tax=Parabacteroides sp. PFB2-10 TaxID=1742405 RepID=UPI0024748935|nr:DUF4133 domain-containing protein [Parabacteroides sp. PFB2-10]MDH6313046.1 hypothetical protein [Parabacteroides sp. PFB2-10]MDL2208403.1 DUF4133 domain-containing protein [Parabacteroides sp. OttesenSCG-928-O15]
MVEFNINKGIGRPAEFKGLIAQYLFIFVGGLLAVFIVTVVIYMIGIPQMICVGFGLISGSVLTWATFHLNGKYGQHGLMKVQATKNHPRYISNRRRFGRLFTHIIKKEEKE